MRFGVPTAVARNDVAIYVKKGNSDERHFSKLIGGRGQKILLI